MHLNVAKSAFQRESRTFKENGFQVFGNMSDGFDLNMHLYFWQCMRLAFLFLCAVVQHLNYSHIKIFFTVLCVSRTIMKETISVISNICYQAFEKGEMLLLRYGEFQLLHFCVKID